ncbi:hypothetical protein [Ruminococcus sp. 5_1_39BFAA]|uniref:hypothetical protein n=1 Tax=Ruminococcus sp. 5_1_39BFAA TaxID=457412 RepID=UPI003567BB08
MAGYRRFVAYVYEYRKGKKESNCGFIKVEVRDARCTMEVHLNIEGVTPGVECRIYGFVRKDGLMNGILLESCETGEDSIECLIETDALSMGGSGISLGRMGGMIFTTQTGGFFGTEWDDQPIKPANFREMKIESKADNAETVKLREKGGMRQGEEKAGENAGLEERKPEKKGENGEINREEQESGEERNREKGKNTDEVQMQAEEIQEQPEYRVEMPLDVGQESRLEESDEMQQEHEGEAAQREEERTEENGEIPIPKEGAFAEVEVEYPGNSDAVDIKRAREFAESQEQNTAAEMENEGAINKIESVSASWEPDRIRVSNIVRPNPRSSQSGQASRSTKQSPGPQPGPRPYRASWETCAPFDDSDMAQCWKIHPKDFSCFSRRQCALRNNRFLQYGHYNFGHLLLCRKSNGQYILGVPGSYDQQERFMANMFGFPYFKESRMIEVPKGRGGYWYRLIDAPNIH